MRARNCTRPNAATDMGAHRSDPCGRESASAIRSHPRYQIYDHGHFEYLGGNNLASDGKSNGKL
eukprot:3097257-Pleurochrysis_carterae.AAC.3